MFLWVSLVSSRIGRRLAFTYVKNRHEGGKVKSRTILFTAVYTPHYYW